MGKFLQSSCDSIRDNTSLKEGLVALWGDKAEKKLQNVSFASSKANKNTLPNPEVNSHITNDSYT